MPRESIVSTKRRRTTIGEMSSDLDLRVAVSLEAHLVKAAFIRRMLEREKSLDVHNGCHVSRLASSMSLLPRRPEPSCMTDDDIPDDGDKKVLSSYSYSFAHFTKPERVHSPAVRRHV